MDYEALVKFQEKQMQALREEKAAALEALDLANDLGSFSVHSNQKDMRADLLWEICSRANKMLALKSAAIYLVDEKNQDFTQAFAAPHEASASLDSEIQGLIADQSFAFALQAEGPAFFLAQDKSSHLLLHSLATQSRIRGMFVAHLNQSKESILDTTLKLFSVVMLSASHALENQETQEFMQNVNRELDHKVRERTVELMEANERLGTTISGMQAGVLLVDAESRNIVDANPKALEMIGRPQKEVVGQLCNTYFCSAKTGQCPVLDLGQEVDNAERVMHSKDGTEIPILKTVSRVMVGGRPHLVESFVDLTEQKKLADLREDVDRIMRHDLKTPLNGIIGLPDVMLMDDNLTDSQREFLQHIKGAGHSLLKMINMSLDLFKMETGRYEYVPVHQNLMVVIRTVFKDLADMARMKRVVIRVLLDGEPVDEDASLTVPCDEFLIYSLLSNLIKNALEATPGGETVTLAIKREPDQVRISLHNEGVVPQKIRKTIFEKYVSAGKTGGTGLGTYSARLIATVMNGSITCESSEEAGTTMTVILPNTPVTI